MTTAELLLSSWTLRKTAKVAIDGGVAATALLLAFLLRFDGRIPSDVAANLPMLIMLVVGTKVGADYLIGGHRRIWHYTSLNDAVALAVSGAGATVLLLALTTSFLVVNFNRLSIVSVQERRIACLAQMVAVMAQKLHVGSAGGTDTSAALPLERTADTGEEKEVA